MYFYEVYEHVTRNKHNGIITQITTMA